MFLILLNRALAIVVQSVLFQQVHLRHQALINRHFDRCVSSAGIGGVYRQSLFEEVLCLLQVSRVQFIPHRGHTVLVELAVQTNRLCIITAVSAECLHQFGTELEVTGSGRTCHAQDDRVFLEELVKRTGRNRIREVLVRLEFL